MSQLVTVSTHLLSKFINSAVDITNATVDYYLPPLEEELKELEQQEKSGQENEPGQQTVDPDSIENIIKRVGSLSNKMRVRVVGQASLRLQPYQQRSQEIMEQVRDTFDLIKYAKALQEAGRLSLERLHAPAQTLSVVINSAVELTNKTVDYYLPPSEEEMKELEQQIQKEQSEQGNDSEQQPAGPETIENLIKKIGTLSNKLRVRVLREASSKLQTYQQRSHEVVDQMRSTFDLIKHAKALEDLGRQLVSRLLRKVDA